MRKFQGCLTAVVLVFLGTLTLAVAGYVGYQGLGTGELTTPEEICRWLASTDLTTVGLDEKLKVARRMEQHFRGGRDWSLELSQLDPSQHGQFMNSMLELSRVWFIAKVDAYFAAPEQQRSTYLDREISNLMNWRILDPGRTGSWASNLPLGDLAQQVMRFIDQSDPAEQSRIAEFFAAIQGRMFQFDGPANSDDEE